jgi:hypothetical protein
MIGLCLMPVQELRLRQTLRLDLSQLDVAGGATLSIFPLVEALLASSEAHRVALEAASSRRVDKGFRSIVDFVLVATFPRLLRPCLAFYEGNGEPLGERIGERERRYLERRMLVALEFFVACKASGVRPSWSAALEALDAFELSGEAAATGAAELTKGAA